MSDRGKNRDREKERREEKNPNICIETGEKKGTGKAEIPDHRPDQIKN